MAAPVVPAVWLLDSLLGWSPGEVGLAAQIVGLAIFGLSALPLVTWRALAIEARRRSG